MYRVIQGFQPSAVTMLGGVFMAGGALIYMNDSVPKLRNMHTFLWPAFALMALGAVIALLGAVFVDRSREAAPAPAGPAQGHSRRRASRHTR